MRFLFLSLAILLGVLLFFPARGVLGTGGAWGALAAWIITALALHTALLNRRGGAVATGLAIISDKRRVLAQRRRQLVTADAYGHPVTEKWEREVAYFIEHVLKEGLTAKRHAFDRISPAGRATLMAAIETAATAPDPGLSAFAEVTAATTPADYEAICAERLRHSGWTARLTGGSGDQGADVIAEKDGRRLVLQCKLYTKSVNNKAVQEASAARQHERAHLAAVVTPAGYTASARSLAGTTGVLLLHHDDLMTAFADGDQPAAPSSRHRKPAKLAPASPEKTDTARKRARPMSEAEKWEASVAAAEKPAPAKKAGGRRKKETAARTEADPVIQEEAPPPKAIPARAAPAPAALKATAAPPPAPDPAPTSGQRRRAAMAAAGLALSDPDAAETPDSPAPADASDPPAPALAAESEPVAASLSPGPAILRQRMIRRFTTAVALVVLVASVGGIVHVWIGR